jgi:hypothetical protein
VKLVKQAVGRLIGPHSPRVRSRWMSPFEVAALVAFGRLLGRHPAGQMSFRKVRQVDVRMALRLTQCEKP